MRYAFRDVYDFHKKFRPDLIGCRPFIPDEHVELRWRLIAEEIAELREAIDGRDIAGVADSIADSIYVLLGMAVTCGIYMPQVWDEVQRSNMAKVGGGHREDGKVLKPDGWVAPDILGILTRQLSLSDEVSLDDGGLDEDDGIDIFQPDLIFPNDDSVVDYNDD